METAIERFSRFNSCMHCKSEIKEASLAHALAGFLVTGQHLFHVINNLGGSANLSPGKLIYLAVLDDKSDVYGVGNAWAPWTANWHP